MPLNGRIRDLIIDSMLDIWHNESRWTKGAIARRASGSDDVSVHNPFAVSWCAVGCKAKAMKELGLGQYADEFEEFMDYYAREEFNVSTVVEFNDNEHTTFEDVRLFVKCLKDKDLLKETRVCHCPDCITSRMEDEECIDSL